MMPPSGEVTPDIQQLLRQIYDAARQRDIPRLEALVEQASGEGGVSFSLQEWLALAEQEEQEKRRLAELEEQRTRQDEEQRRRREEEQRLQQEARRKRGARPWAFLLIPLALLVGAGLAIGGFLLGRFTVGGFGQSTPVDTPESTPMITPTKPAEAVVVLPTTPPATVQPTLPVTANMTATIIVTSTMPVTDLLSVETPAPLAWSRYYLPPGTALYPPVPVQAYGAWVLDEGDALVSPPLTDEPVWTAAASRDLLADKEPYYHTAFDGAIQITWTLDAPLEAGLYQVYVLDTQLDSAGEQAFTVLLDGAPAQPVRGRSTVVFNSFQQGKQAGDAWLPLGVYRAERGQMLAVSVQIQGRSRDIPFALDRLMVARLSWEAEQLASALPEFRPVYGLMDDIQASYYAVVGGVDTRLNTSKQPASLNRGALAWGSGYKLQPAPWQSDMAVIWQPVGRLPVGQYELLVWVPPGAAAARASFDLLADGKPVPRESPAELALADFTGQWVSLGLWRLNGEAAVAVRMLVAKDAALLADGRAAEIIADAVALVYAGE